MNQKIRFSWIKLFLCFTLSFSLFGCRRTTQPTPSSQSREISQESVATLNTIPAYTGEPYVTINNNVPFFEENEWTTNSFHYYFDLDELGRVTQAYACLGTDLLPDNKRQDISSVKPTGFINHNYSFMSDGMVYNRAHLIAYMLSGQNANPKNLMTGTRYLNIDGMLPFENIVHDYIQETGNHVMYRVTPIFEGDDLVARGVLMEAYSVEDQGKGVEFCVYCYNVQPGVAINYATGENKVDESMSDEQIAAFYDKSKKSTKTPAANNQTSNTNSSVSQSSEKTQNPPANLTPLPSDKEIRGYVLNTKSKKFHLPECSGAQNLKNKLDVFDSKEHLIANGYTPCQICMPS